MVKKKTTANNAHQAEDAHLCWLHNYVTFQAFLNVAVECSQKSVTYGIGVFGWTTASWRGKDCSVSGTHRKSIWNKSQTSFSALSLTNLSPFCMRKDYQKVLSKDIGTQFNLVPPFPPVCPSAGGTLAAHLLYRRIKVVVMAFETVRHCPIEGRASTPTPSPCAKQSLFFFYSERLKGYAKPYEGEFWLFGLTRDVDTETRRESGRGTLKKELFCKNQRHFSIRRCR